jgi:hypothetical protein
VRQRLPGLAAYFEREGVDYTVTFAHCFLTLTINDMSTQLAERVLDLLLLDGPGVIIGMVLKGLQLCEPALETMSADQIITFIRKDLWDWVEEWCRAHLPEEEKKIELPD